MSYIFGISLGGILLGALALGFAYRLWLMPVVCWHFGEESRRDREANRRRREFERHCYRTVTCIFISIVAGVARGVMDVLVPELSGIALAIQILVLLVAAVFGWAAFNRWREPFEE